MVREEKRAKADVVSGVALDGVKTAGKLMQHALAGPHATAADDLDDIERIKNKVRGATGNGVTSESLLDEIAAVVRSRFPRDRFSELLHTTDQQRRWGKIKTTPAYYFLTTFRMLARRFGVDLENRGWKKLDEYRAAAAERRVQTNQ